jgi:phage repressor protein C with HTH and peptisase S24 domain
VILRMLRVEGSSLEPEYRDGDYALVTSLSSIRRGDVLAFRRASGDVYIKRVEQILPDDRFFVTGTHPNSIDSRHFGPVPRRDVLGKVIWHIRK